LQVRGVESRLVGRERNEETAVGNEEHQRRHEGWDSFFRLERNLKESAKVEKKKKKKKKAWGTNRLTIGGGKKK